MEPFQRPPAGSGGPSLLPIAPWRQYEHLSAGFTGRDGGVSRAPRASLNTALHVGDEPDDVIANRRRIAAALGWPFDAWTCAEQVHGDRVHRVTAADRGRGRLERASAIPDADALITDEPDVLLVMYFADCVPLYFYDPESGAIGLAHAGWRGTAAGVAARTVEAMAAAFGCRPERLAAAIGPAIGACCYEVDEPVLRQMRPLAEELADLPEGDGAPMLLPGQEGRAGLDLKEINRRIMIKAGIMPSRIEMSLWCTGCRTDLFFSHRRENGSTGRMMSWLGRKSR